MENQKKNQRNGNEKKTEKKKEFWLPTATNKTVESRFSFLERVLTILEVVLHKSFI